jgi:hypothetical protein
MYRTNDGAVLRSTEQVDIVRELREMSNTPTESDSQFMRETADRIRAKLDRRVRYHNEVVFVADLLEAGLLIDDDKGEG